MFGGFGVAFGSYGAAYGYEYDDGHPRYRNMAEKSAAALRREEEAKNKFEEAREQLESKEDLKPGTKITMELLKPSCHLTGPCWTTFLRHVRSHEGWVAKRREATAEEKQQHKETRKGKVYFIDLVFNVPKAKGIMEKKPVTAVQGISGAGSSGGMFGSPNDEEESSEDDETPAQKKAKIIDE